MQSEPFDGWGIQSTGLGCQQCFSVLLPVAAFIVAARGRRRSQPAQNQPSHVSPDTPFIELPGCILRKPKKALLL